jgi:hypothetical protein
VCGNGHMDWQTACRGLGLAVAPMQRRRLGDGCRSKCDLFSESVESRAAFRVAGRRLLSRVGPALPKLVRFGPFRSMTSSLPSFSLVEQSTTVWLMARRHEPPWAVVLVSTSAVRLDTASMRHGASWPLTIICPMAILQSGSIALATRVSTTWVPSSDIRSERYFAYVAI